MKKIFKLSIFIIIIFILSCANDKTIKTEQIAESVKQEFLHAWNCYTQYAWSHDAVKPLSKGYHNWYDESLLMTPVDAFDTMILMGLKEEAAAAKKIILEKLSFDQDFSVQSFEINIRLLGGLITAYQLDGDIKFLNLAEDIAKRMLPIFDSPTGMPYRYVHLQTGAVKDHYNNPAEISTYIIEYGTLSKLTGNPIYYEKAKKALTELYNHSSDIGLIGTVINIETGEWINKTCHISGMIDSYYEYLLKAWLLFEDQDIKKMWETSIKAVDKYLADESKNGLFYGQVDMDTGKKTASRFGALDAFFPAVLALGGNLQQAEKLQESCFKMWNLQGIEPEQIDYSTMEIISPSYLLRPEIIESAYYLYHYTKDPKYLKMGEAIFNDIKKYCRTDDGYAALKNVITKEKDDSMESFFLAETMKYFYLLFASEETLQFDKVIFNTEAHPIQKTWENNSLN